MITIYPEKYLDYTLDVSRGRISGAQPFSGYGKRTTTGAEANVLWPNGAYSFPPSAGVQLSVVSASINDAAAGTGIRTIEIHYLDANLVDRTETLVMNGTTPVLTVATNIRFVQCMHMVTFGTLKVAAGAISASNGGDTYSYIAIGDVRCTSSVRMVPAGKRLIVTTMYAGSASGSAAASSIVNIASPSFDGHNYITNNVFIPIASASFQDNSSGITIPCPLSFTEGQAIGLTFATDKAATIVGSWFGFLENA